MNTTGQPTSLHELTAKYNAIHSQVDAMGKELLKLMRHPEATAEQIDEGRLKYFLTYTQWVDTRMLLREKHPTPARRATLQKELPWNAVDE